MKNIKFEKIIIIAILFSGILLSTIQFIYNRSLWLDEAMISLNIITKNSLELLKPLDYEQVAPILFLQIEKLFSLLLPKSEYGLKLFPLLSYLGSLYFFYRILKLIFKNQYTIILSLSLFVFNATLIYYSSEVKQYMTDVLVITFMYFLILKNYKKDESKYYLLVFCGAASIFLSNIAPIILFTLGIHSLYNYLINKPLIFKYLTFTFSVWLITFLIYYYYFIHDHPSKEYMINYWLKEDAFMPCNPFSLNFYIFLYDKFEMIFTSLIPFSRTGEISLCFLFLIGSIILIYRKKIDVLILIFTPLILHLILSANKLYPFDLRLLLYISPILIITISFGFESTINFIFKTLKIKINKFLALIIPLIPLFMFLKIGIPLKMEEIKENIFHIQKHIIKKDKIYVFYGALPAFKYYKHINYIKGHLEIIYDSKNINNKDKYIDELKKINGRIWLLFSHKFSDVEYNIIKKLDSLGYTKIESFNSFGSKTYLYDFGYKK